MKTIKEKVLASMKKAGATFLAETTARRVHTNKFGSRSNVAKELKQHQLKTGESFILVVGYIARSTHGESQILIFKNNQGKHSISSADTCFRDYHVISN